MMFKSRIQVFVVTFMLLIDYSYLKIVVLPKITDRNYGEYLQNIEWKTLGKILNSDEFHMVKTNYEEKMKIEYEKPENAGLIREIGKIATFTEKRLLRMLMNYEKCGIAIQERLHNYIDDLCANDRITSSVCVGVDRLPSCALRARSLATPTIREQTRKSYYEQKKLKKAKETYPAEVETMHDDNPLMTLEQQAEEELNFLKSLKELSGNNGRIKTLYLSTVYGSNEHIIHEQKNSIDSVWLYLLRTIDPMFGEKYNSYAFRIISMKKMPLPKEEIPKYYGDGKLYLFDEFDIWPELNAVFVMYYIFNCPLKEAIIFDASHGVNERSSLSGENNE